MSESLSTADPSPAAAAEDGPPSAKFGVREWSRWLWRQLTSMRVALILLFLLAVASIPGSLFPQRGSDPLAVGRYFDEHAAIAPWLDRLGLFDVYASPWFAAVYLLLCISLVGCIVPRTIEHAKALRRQPPRAPSRLQRLQGYTHATTEQPSAAVLGDAASYLRRKHWRVRTGDGWVSAEKGYTHETGNVVFHICLLLLLAAVAVGSLFGWRATVIVVEGRGFSNALTQYDSFSAGKLVDVSNLAPFTVTLEDFQAKYQQGGTQAGAPRDYSADLNYSPEPGEAPTPITIGVNTPLSVSGAKVFLQGHGYAPTFVVRDAAGQVIYDDAAVFLPQDGNLTSVGVIKIPDSAPPLGFQGVLLPTAVLDPVAGPISTFPAADDPAVFLTAWQGDLGLNSGEPQSVFRLDTTDMTEIGVDAMRPGETWVLPDGLGEVDFTGVSQFVSFTVAHDPGKEFALVAGLTAIAGLMLSLFIPRRRVWVRATADEAGRTLVDIAGLSRTESSMVDDDTAALRAAVVPADGGSQ